MLSSEKKEIMCFGIMTVDILELVERVKTIGCQCIAMESIDIYWEWKELRL